MKYLGSLANGNNIIEVSPRELQVLNHLKLSAEGHGPYYDARDASSLPQFDAEPLLAAISDWLDIKFHANALRNIANDIDEHLKLVKEKVDDQPDATA